MRLPSPSARTDRRALRPMLAATLSSVLAACAAYHAAPLPTAVDAAARPNALRADMERMRLEPLAHVVVDPGDGLDPLEVAVLAVLNNPDLAARRVALGVNDAQVFSAGLLPDPQFSASADHPIAGPDTRTALNLSPSLDLAALLGRSSATAAARETRRQADLDLLWAEWGTAQQARQLAETAVSAEARIARLDAALALAADRYARSDRALQNHDVTLQITAADLAVKLDAETQRTTAVNDARKARRDLNALLNLDIRVVLPLTAGSIAAPYDAGAVARAVDALPERRADLLALRAGYAAQDSTLQGAVLAQFPLTQIALSLARDTGAISTAGGSLAFALPIFNGGRGAVRVQSATRDQLRAEYQARLDQAAVEARGAEADVVAAAQQAEVLRADVPRLEALVRPAQAAYARGDIDSQTYLTLSQNALTRRADLDALELAIRLAEIQLETALFLPPADSRVSR